MEQQNAISVLMVTLHRYHRQLAELEYRRKKGRLRIELMKNKETAAQSALLEAQNHQKTLELAARDKEKDLAAREDAINKRKEQLGQAKTNKEYLSLKEQIESDEKINNELADLVLTALEETEKFQENVAAAQKSFDEAQKNHKQAVADYAEELPVIENSIKNYQQKLFEAEKTLPRPFQPIYRDLVANLGGEEALAPVLNHKFCGHCNQQIPIHHVTEICDGVPRTCQACGRLLFVPEDFVLQ